MTEEQKNHYFDWAATSPSDEQILKEAFDETINLWGNPSSLHSLGKEAKKKLIAHIKETSNKEFHIDENNIGTSLKNLLKMGMDITSIIKNTTEILDPSNQLLKALINLLNKTKVSK